MLCSQEEPKNDGKFSINNEFNLKVPEDKISQYYKKHLDYKQFIHDFYAYNFGIIVPESGVPEHSEDPLIPQKYPVFLNKTEKCQNDNHELDNVEFQQPCNDRKSPVSSESDIETVVSDDFRMPNFEDRFCDDQNRMFQFCNDSSVGVANEQDDNKDSDGNMSEDDFRTRVRHSIHRLSNDINFSERQREEKELAEQCTICASERLTLQHDSYYDSSVSRVHTDCACSMDCSREHLSPSREIMRQVMGQVEIVPHGQPIVGYTSSVENGSRAYHHGLLSHSYPSHSGNNQDRSSHSRSKRLLNHRSMKNRVLHKERDMSTSRCYNQNANSSCWNSNPCYSSPLMIPRIQHLRMEVDLVSNSESTYSSCSSCQSISSVSSPEWESPSPDTSSYNSECQDDEEIALALQAAEISTRNKARSRFKSSRDLLHKLFVCVSGVADQLQTNYASDLRNILKSVFDMNCSQIQEPEKCVNCSSLGCNGEMHTDSPFVEGILNENAPDLNNDLTGTLLNNNMGDDDERDRSSVDSAEEVVPDNAPIPPLVISTIGQENENNRNFQSGPPEWMPDELSANCMACTIQFTILRRRHHCRNCGKIFCSRCSSNSIPLPRYGHLKPVRVCNQCFMYQLTNLVMQRQL